MLGSFDNMRIHFYGVQGSGSIFPAKAEREEFRLHSDVKLMEQIFASLQKKAGTDGKLNQSIEDILQGPLNRNTLMRYREQFDLEEQRVYGGWTSCFRIETSDGYDIVFDCGSGFRICANDIQEKWADDEERDLYIFGSHAHFDHTEGFDQAAICFDPRNNVHIYANHSYLRSLDNNLGIFSHQIDMDLKGNQTPLNYELMPAKFDSTEIRDCIFNPPPQESDPIVGKYHNIYEPIVIGKTIIQPFEVFHPDPCLAYRIEHNKKSVCILY